MMEDRKTMQNKRIYLLYNPVAGRGKIRANLSDIIDIFSRAGYETIVRTTEGRGSASVTARDADPGETEFFCCCGGDGTLDEVVSGIMESGRPRTVGYIPAGSTNDFAASLGIPSDMKKAAETILSGKTMSCDIGRFNEENYFVYVAAFGLFTDISYSTPQEQKNLLGHSAYILQALPEILRLGRMQPYAVHVQADDRSLDGDFAVGLITNSLSVGGFEGLTGTHVDLRDGLFEVTLIRMPKNPVETNSLLQSLMQSDLEHNSLIVHFQTSRLLVQSEQALSWTRDGEFGGAHHTAELVALRRALQIRVPR